MKPLPLPDEVAAVAPTTQALRLLLMMWHRGYLTIEQAVHELWGDDPTGGPEDAAQCVQTLVSRTRRGLVGTGWCIPAYRADLTRRVRAYRLVKGEQEYAHRRCARREEEPVTYIDVAVSRRVVQAIRERSKQEKRPFSHLIEEMLAAQLEREAA
jgi:hypothetical protein